MNNEKIRKGLGQNGLQLERNIKSDRKRFCESIRNRKRKKKQESACLLLNREGEQIAHDAEKTEEFNTVFAADYAKKL